MGLDRFAELYNEKLFMFFLKADFVKLGMCKADTPNVRRVRWYNVK